MLCLLCLGAPGLAAAKPGSGTSVWQKITVRRGDSLSRLFARHDLPASSWRSILRLGGNASALKSLHPGDVIALRRNASGQLVGLRYRLGSSRTLSIYRVNGHLHEGLKSQPTHLRKQVAAGKIRQSLPKSLASAGVPASIANQLAIIYRPRLDLSEKIQPGDHFSVLYDARYEKNRLVAAGPVLAARITTDEGSYSAFRAVGANGEPAYYDVAGKPYRPGISRHPVNYTRISSPFSLSRMDPAVHFVHPHYGVDMAARLGTPVRAAGDGRVKYVGWEHGYGRLVELRHADGYTTRYAHLHRFAHGLHDGEYVHRGEVIGQVGSTGWSTGPHLLFEIRKHGVPHDPMTMTLPDGKPLRSNRLARFKNRIQPAVATLNKSLIASTRLAAWVSSPSCARSAQLNARFALDPRGTADAGSLSGLLCPEHRPAAAHRTARVATARPVVPPIE